ncbi:MAG: carboxypeptidase-like regulatory domain-containing protein, partial [Acidobacteriota bacterium]
EIRGSVPSTNTNGSSGPAVFTVRRQSNSANNAFNVDFTLGGTAVRDIDYVLNVVGNSITFPGGQTTYDVTVTPLTAAGDKTVVMSIAAPPGSSYFTLPGRDAASVNIIDNGTPSTELSLSSVTPASGGNGGVVVSKIFGDNIANGAAVKLTRAGEPDLAGANVNVSSGGKSLTTVFDLNGRTVGRWNIVVTNPNSTTAVLTNGFAVEANVGPRLTVQVSGASTIRASHTRSRYDVVYTNHGNTDAFGVVLFVIGVAANECVDQNDGDCTFLETPEANVSDIPGQDPFPAWVRQVPNVVPTDLPNVIGPGLRHIGAIPVLIPRIPAHGTGTFRFSMRFTVIGESALQKINAAILPPMVNAVTVPGAAKPTVEMRAFAPANASSDKNCIDSIFVNAINCALSLIPGQACLAAGVGAITTVAQIAGNASIQGDKAINAVSGTQMYAAGLSAMTCLKQATPIGELLNVIGCLAGFLDSCSTCLGPDACNPFSIAFVQSADPNEKTGVRRFSSQNYVQNSNLLYSIGFENQATATAPAQDVVVTDQLDISTLDIATLELGDIRFGDTTINVPAGLKTYSTEVDLRPSKDLLVDVNANLDQNSGVITWIFHSIDPFTRQAPTDALAGFLPPNVLGTEGAGKVMFTVSPKTSLTLGTEIRNRARITFDLNPPIDTNEWVNTIDDSEPASQVSSLPPTEANVAFPVTWSGTDTGSGIADYSIYVSDNGAPPGVWLINTSDTTAIFAGQRGHTYSFYSVAQDNAANLEIPPAIPDTTTVVLAPTAAGVEVSGRISTPAGQAISNAYVSITDPFGVTRTALTNPFGYYRFDDVRAGRAYVVNVGAKQHQFASRVLELNDNLVGLDFVSLE